MNGVPPPAFSLDDGARSGWNGKRQLGWGRVASGDKRLARARWSGPKRAFSKLIVPVFEADRPVSNIDEIIAASELDRLPYDLR